MAVARVKRSATRGRRARGSTSPGLRYAPSGLQAVRLGPVVRLSRRRTRDVFVTRSPDERSDIRGLIPACRFAHAGYELQSEAILRQP